MYVHHLSRFKIGQELFKFLVKEGLNKKVDIEVYGYFQEKEG